MEIIATKYTKSYNDEYFLQKLDKYTSCEFFNKYKNYLSLYFVFFYLYYNLYEPINSRLYYNEICDYYKYYYSIEEITKIYDSAYFNKNNTITTKNIYQTYCDRKCNNCIYKDICY